MTTTKLWGVLAQSRKEPSSPYALPASSASSPIDV